MHRAEGDRRGGASRDDGGDRSHSGLYGGAAPNALQVLAQLIAASKDDQGRVAVPGFYDRVIEPTPRERQAYAALPFNEKELLERLELGGWDGEPGYTPLSG